MNDAVDECRHLVEGGIEDEALLDFLRCSGHSRIDAIRVLVELRGLSLSEAKETVHLSRTWADLRESAEELHEFIEQAIIKGEESK